MDPRDTDNFFRSRGVTEACAACGYAPMEIVEGRFFLVAAAEPDEAGAVPAYAADPDPEGLALEAAACVNCGYIRLHGLGFVQ